MNLIKIKTFAVQKDISLQKLAESVGMTYQTLNRGIRTGEMKLSDLGKISAILQVSISDIVSEGTVNDDGGFVLAYKSNVANGENNKIHIADELEISRLKEKIKDLEEKVADKQKLIDVYEQQLSLIAKKN